MTSDSERRASLDGLLDDIYQWARVRDPEVVRRKSEAIDLDSKLFIVGEACARDQVRTTGVSWIRHDGNLGPAGANLEGFLNLVGYTVRPPLRIAVPGSAQAQPRSRTVYTTDLIPCYPLPDGKVRPDLVEEARVAGFLEREIALLRPRALLVLGHHSYRGICRWFLRTRPCRRFLTEVARTEAGAVQHLRCDGWSIPMFVLRHPSPANPANSAWYRDIAEGKQATNVVAALRREVGMYLTVPPGMSELGYLPD